MTKGFREFDVSREAVTQARDLGVSGDVEAKVARMAKYSAPFTRPGVNANRRYHEFVFKIEDGVVRSVMKFDVRWGKYRGRKRPQRDEN